MSPAVPFCPNCLGPIADSRCDRCGIGFRSEGGVLDYLAEREGHYEEAVEEFYTGNPFPGYAPGDDAGTLIDRSRRSPFLEALDAAIPPDARVIDCGCGTAQLASFLALAGPRRTVVGVDGCMASLSHADGFRERTGITNLQLVRTDLFDLPVEPGRFDVVISRGVVHHTHDPDRAIGCVADLTRPGGFLLLGFYETRARLVHRIRRGLGRVLGRPGAALDPILRRRDIDDEKKRIWIEDQYHHPLERILPLPGVLAVLRELGFRFVRTVPPAPGAVGMFDATAEPGAVGLFRLRLGWTLRGFGDEDAGLVCVVARRQEAS
ncbi:MAG: class I SAM-dependent methyltransferase [Planctomycetota bacterium]|nr:class I SAM-dependent methyltransferase [Planctomycetota bacterium]